MPRRPGVSGDHPGRLAVQLDILQFSRQSVEQVAGDVAPITTCGFWDAALCASAKAHIADSGAHVS
jgi:hypothetical protein